MPKNEQSHFMPTQGSSLPPAVGDDIILSSAQDNVYAVNHDSTLPTSRMNNVLIQNHLLMMRQHCHQLGIKQVHREETAEFVPPKAKKKPKISSSFEEDYQSAYMALKKISGMNSTALPHCSFVKRVSSGSEIGHAMSARSVAMVDASVVDLNSSISQGSVASRGH